MIPERAGEAGSEGTFQSPSREVRVFGSLGRARRSDDRHVLTERLVVLGRINGLPDNVVVDLFGRLGLRWLGCGYNRG